MVERSFGGRVLPSVQISVGRSNQDLSDLKRSLTGIEDELRRMQQAARDASAAVNEIKTPTRASPTTAPSRSETENARLDRQREQQEAPLQASARRVAGAEASAEYSKQQADERAQDRDVESRFRAAREAKREKERSSLLYRGVSAAGWMPGVPPSVYMSQMALGEMGLGLPLGMVAGGMGVLGLGMAGLGASAALVGQNLLGEQMATRLGTTPSFATGGAVTGMLDTLGQQFHLTGKQPQDIAAGLAAGGLGRAETLNGGNTGAFAQAASLVNTFGLTIQQATQLVSKQYTDMNRSGQEVTSMLQNLAQTALATGIPAGNLAAILAGAPNLAAGVSPGQAGQAAGVFAQLYGTTQAATSMAQLASAHGTGAFALAGFLGMPVSRLDQMRGTRQGIGQVADMLDARARQLSSQNGPEGGFAAFNAFLQGAGGQAISWTAWQRALQQAPNAGVMAARVPVSAVAAVPGSAQAGIIAAAAGNLAGGAQASQPWNVKDMAVNAMQVTIAGAGNQLQGLGAVISGQASPGQLAQIVAQGGIAGNAALAGQAAGGNLGALGKLVEHVVPAAIQAAVTPTMGAAGAAVEGRIVNHVLHAIIDVRERGQVIGTKRITSPLPNSGQTYGQYTPPHP